MTKCPMHVKYVFLNVRFFLRFDAIAVLETGKKSHRQGIQRKGIFAWPIHFVAFDICWWIWDSDRILSGSHTGESVLAFQVKMWKRERVFKDEVFIENTCLGVGSRKRRTKFKWGRSFKHWSRGSSGHWFPETEYLCASAIFVSETSGIPPILNYRSVSPIKQTIRIQQPNKQNTRQKLINKLNYHD